MPRLRPVLSVAAMPSRATRTTIPIIWRVTPPRAGIGSLFGDPNRQTGSGFPAFEYLAIEQATETLGRRFWRGGRFGLLEINQAAPLHRAVLLGRRFRGITFCGAHYVVEDDVFAVVRTFAESGDLQFVDACPIGLALGPRRHFERSNRSFHLHPLPRLGVDGREQEDTGPVRRQVVAVNLKVEDTFHVRLDPKPDVGRAGEIQRRKTKTCSEVVGRARRGIHDRSRRKLSASLGRIPDHGNFCFMRCKSSGDRFLGFKIGDHMFALLLLGGSLRGCVERHQSGGDDGQ